MKKIYGHLWNRASECKIKYIKAYYRTYGWYGEWFNSKRGYKTPENK
jgi:hypothetical protein